MNKFEVVSKILADDQPVAAEANPTILDVGCRDCSLKKYLPDHFKYEGVDLFQNKQGTVTHVLNLSEGLPFKDDSFDYVVALDVLEHLDDLQFGLEEVLRVSKQKLIVMLPNISYLTHRISFLIKGHLNTDKYDLIYNGVPDRHRWLTITPQSDKFMNDFSVDKKTSFQSFLYIDSPKKKFASILLKAFGMNSNIFSIASFYIFSKRNVS